MEIICSLPCDLGDLARGNSENESEHAVAPYRREARRPVTRGVRKEKPDTEIFLTQRRKVTKESFPI